MYFVYFSSILLTISSSQTAVPSIPMQNLWPILIREGSSTVAVLKGIMLHAGEQIFSSNFEELIEEGAFTSLLISAEMLIRVLQQNNKK